MNGCRTCGFVAPNNNVGYLVCPRCAEQQTLIQLRDVGLTPKWVPMYQEPGSYFDLMFPREKQGKI